MRQQPFSYGDTQPLKSQLPSQSVYSGGQVYKITRCITSRGITYHGASRGITGHRGASSSYIFRQTKLQTRSIIIILDLVTAQLYCMPGLKDGNEFNWLIEAVDTVYIHASMYIVLVWSISSPQMPTARHIFAKYSCGWCLFLAYEVWSPFHDHLLLEIISSSSFFTLSLNTYHIELGNLRRKLRAFDKARKTEFALEFRL